MNRLGVAALSSAETVNFLQEIICEIEEISVRRNGVPGECREPGQLTEKGAGQ
jgi:hypothetical protein